MTGLAEVDRGPDRTSNQLDSCSLTVDLGRGEGHRQQTFLEQLGSPILRQRRPAKDPCRRSQLVPDRLMLYEHEGGRSPLWSAFRARSAEPVHGRGGLECRGVRNRTDPESLGPCWVRGASGP
jgi:hypothetical protein